MTQYKMLDEILHPCSKCGLNLNHRITLMDGDTPARVLCLTCHSERRFKDPNKAVPKRRVVAGAKEKSKARQSSEQRDWQLKLTDTSKTPKKYNINEHYALDDHIYHPKFGKGLVIGFDYPDKVHFYFEGEGVKVLKGQKQS